MMIFIPQQFACSIISFFSKIIIYKKEMLVFILPTGEKQKELKEWNKIEKIIKERKNFIFFFFIFYRKLKKKIPK